VSNFFRPNIGRHGRIARGVIGTLLLITGIILVDFVLWLGLIFVVAGLFAIYSGQVDQRAAEVEDPRAARDRCGL